MGAAGERVGGFWRGEGKERKKEKSRVEEKTERERLGWRNIMEEKGSGESSIKTVIDIIIIVAVVVVVAAAAVIAPLPPPPPHFP